MPAKKRFKTKYPGVHYIEGKVTGSGRKERIYYIMYYKNGRLIEEKAGRQFQDRMTAAKARRIRIECIEGKRLPRRERRDIEKGKNGNEQKSVDLELLENKWLLFTKSATDGFSLYDSELKVLEINDAGEKQLPIGIKKEDALGQPIETFSPDIIKSGRYEKYLNVIKTGVPFNVDDLRLPPEYGEDKHYNIKSFKVGDGLGMIISDITERKHAEEALKKREMELEEKSVNLEEANIALKVILESVEKEKKKSEEKIVSNVKELVEPYLNDLKMIVSDERQRKLINIIEANINDILSPFSHKMASKIVNFTPMEIKVANLVKQGRITKDIAEVLNLSVKTICYHRSNIRKKLGIENTKINLRSSIMAFLDD